MEMFRDWYEGLREVELEREMWQWGISEYRSFNGMYHIFDKP